MSYIKKYSDHFSEMPIYWYKFTLHVTKNFTEKNAWNDLLEKELNAYDFTLTYHLSTYTYPKFYSVDFKSEQEYFLFKMRYS